MSELIVNEHKYESVFEFLIRILIDLLHRAHNLHKEVKIENREKARSGKQCEFCNYLLDKSLISQGCQSGPGDPGDQGGRGGQGGQCGQGSQGG